MKKCMARKIPMETKIRVPINKMSQIIKPN